MHLAENIKKKVSIPVIAANKIRDPHFAEKILQEGKADLIALARPLVADPEWPLKASEGRPRDIRPCISCCRCIQNVLEKDQPIWCTVNPVAGREGKRISQAEKPKKVLIVGGGPAGMEAGIVAARRGHDVYLIEEENKLGGQMLLAARPPGKSDIQKLTDYLTIRARKLGVKIELGKTVTPGVIDEMKPDVLVVAMGSMPITPRIPRAKGKNVVAADEVLWENVETGNEVAIIGGGQIGLETAEYLAEKDKRVTVIEKLGDVAADMPSISRLPLLLSLDDYGVRILTKTEPLEITGRGVQVKRKEKSQIVKADTVVLAAGLQPNYEFAELENKVPEQYLIGDCKEPRNILEAIHDGFEVALKIGAK